MGLISILFTNYAVKGKISGQTNLSKNWAYAVLQSEANYGANELQAKVQISVLLSAVSGI